MVSRWYLDDACSSPYCQHLVSALNKYQNKLFVSRNTPLCYLWHLRYIFNHTLKSFVNCLIVSFDKLYNKHLGIKHHAPKRQLTDYLITANSLFLL